MARQRIVAGDVLSIPLEGGEQALALVLDDPLVAFYQVNEGLGGNPDAVQELPLLFKVWTERRALKSGQWPKVAHVNVLPENKEPPIFFMQDIGTGRLSITVDGSEGRDATFDECKGLERAAVWAASHIEDRIRDAYADKPCVWVDSMRPELKSR